MVKTVDHVGIAVRSIAEARQFYEALGLEVESIEEVESEGVRVAMIPLGPLRIELLEPLTDDSPVGRFLAKRGPGIHHLCLASSDVRADSETLREGGFSVLRDEPTPGAGGHLVQFIHPKSSGGVLYELAEESDAVDE